jgi:anti-sigma B factor antagonist
VEFAVDHRVHGDLAIVTVAGEIDVFTCARLRDELQDLIQDGTQHLIVDLNDVEFLDSAGLGVLVGVYHRLRGGEGSLVFVGANDRVRKIFHITQLMKIFPLHATLDAALEASGGFPDTLLFGFSGESAGGGDVVLVLAVLCGLAVDPAAVGLPGGLLAGAQGRSDLGPRGPGLAG